MKVQETQSLELQNKLTETTKQLEKEQGARKELEILTSVTFCFVLFFFIEDYSQKEITYITIITKTND